MQKIKLLNRFYILIVFLICEFILIFEINAFYDNEKKELLEENIKNVKARFAIVNKTLIDLANSSFRGFINRDNIKEAFANKDRTKLYNILKDDYSYLKTLGFKQIHFHRPNNHSFLRMHKPNRYGDDLTSIRYTVEYTNKYHKGINGFEIGRVFPGIRNVFPLFFDNQYIGSVELSFGMEKLEQEIEKVYKLHSHFLINKKRFNETVFDEYKKYYKQSIENNDYVELIRENEQSFFKNAFFPYKLSSLIDKKMKLRKSFNFEWDVGENNNKDLNNNHYIVTFLPIINAKNDSFMYFIFYKKSDRLKLIKDYRSNKKIVFSLLLIGVFTLIYLLMRNREITLDTQKIVDQERKKYKNLISLASDGIHILDENGDIYEANISFANMLGYEYDELLNLNIKDIDVKITEDNLKKEIKKLIDEPRVFTTKHKRKDGSTFYVQISARGVEIDNKTYLYSSSRDITEQRIAYKKLEKFIDLQNNIIVVSNLKTLNFANKRFFEFTGFKDISQFNKNHTSVSELFINNERFFNLNKLNKDENWIKYLLNEPTSKKIVAMKRADSRLFTFAVTINKFEDEYYIISFTDITQTMLNSIKLEDKTIHDKLTNALNREYFDQNYKSIIEKFTTDNHYLGVAFLDIDHFKMVNDTIGHDGGDEVLIHFVKTIQKSSRENDILIRWGGEEFILLLKINSIKNLKKALENIRKAVEKEDFKVVKKITCSIGSSIYKDNENIYKTIKRADDAVYKAKNSGRNRVEFI